MGLECGIGKNSPRCKRRNSSPVSKRADALKEMAANERAVSKLVAWGEPNYPPALAAIDRKSVV